MEVLELALQDATSSSFRTDSSVFKEHIVTGNYYGHNEQFSSVFLGYVSGLLQNIFDDKLFSNLKRLFGISRMGNAFEYISHAAFLLAETDRMHRCFSSKREFCQLAL